MKRIAFVVSEPMTARAFLVSQLRELSRHYEVALVANTDDGDFLKTLGVEGRTFPVPIMRSIRPLRDLRALFALIRLFRRERFDAVHSVTPKAGLLAMMAARLTGVKLRTHTFTGQVWATRQGLKRRLLRFLDKLIHRFSTFSLVDSGSQRDFLIQEGVVRPEFSGVLADGSIAGVDVERFRADPEKRAAIRRNLSIADDETVFFFLGRLKLEKGVLDLARAFRRVRAGHDRARLLFAGPDEDKLEPQIQEILGEYRPACIFVGATNRPEDYMSAADIFCLPSYREGFGSVLVEAAAAGLPAIASRIYGIDDAVVDGSTGLLHPPADADAIAGLMERLLDEPGLAKALGEAGRLRAHASFKAERLDQAIVDYYQRRLAPGE